MMGIRDVAAAWRDVRRERDVWSNARTLADVGELVAQFCEGQLSETPDHLGPRDPETVPIGGALAHANRSGFVTDCSQPGGIFDRGDQRPVVSGFATTSTVERLRRLVAGTRLVMQVAEPTRWLARDFTPAVPSSRGPAGERGFSAVVSRRAAGGIFGGAAGDELADAMQVQITDPEWGDPPLLWERLSEPDWDNPCPPTAEQRRPVEPPVGTVLETRDDSDVYRIERLAEGWAIQYRSGESEYGVRHTSGRISWRAAWKAWGPPTTGTPFTQVPADAPPLPPAEPDPVPLDPTAPDASGGSLAMPPPAQPHRPPAKKTTTTTSGASMSGSIGDAAAGIRGACDIAGEGQGILSHAIEKLQEARQRLMAASAGSAKADVSDAMGLFGSAIEAIRDAQHGVSAAQSSAEGVAARL